VDQLDEVYSGNVVFRKKGGIAVEQGWLLEALQSPHRTA
jgi:hypothetical protein